MWQMAGPSASDATLTPPLRVVASESFTYLFLELHNPGSQLNRLAGDPEAYP